MEINQFPIDGPLFALLGVVITVVVNWLIQFKKGSSEIQVNERQTLSKDQENFKVSILSELTSCKTVIEKLIKDVQTWQDKASTIQEQKLTLIQELILLNQKVFELERTIQVLKQTIADMSKKEVGS